MGALQKVPDTIRNPIVAHYVAFPNHENPPTPLRKLGALLGVAGNGAFQLR